MKKLIIILLFLGHTGLALAQVPSNLFQQGNEYYKRAVYDSAILKFEEILSSNLESSEVYYNLGNAYFKKKKYSKAILNYERCLKLAPGDEDARFNNSVANLFVVDKIVPLPKIFYREWMDSIRIILSEKGWSVVSIVLIWTISVLAFLFVISRSIFLRKVFFYFSMIFLIAFSFVFLLAKTQADASRSESEGIVFEASVYVKSSPDEKGVDLFILHEGVKVTVLDKVGEWKKVRLLNGNEGWVKSDAFQTI